MNLALDPPSLSAICQFVVMSYVVNIRGMKDRQRLAALETDQSARGLHTLTQSGSSWPLWTSGIGKKLLDFSHFFTKSQKLRYFWPLKMPISHFLSKIAIKSLRSGGLGRLGRVTGNQESIYIGLIMFFIHKTIKDNYGICGSWRLNLAQHFISKCL